jgi:hypothetical protein
MFCTTLVIFASRLRRKFGKVLSLSKQVVYGYNIFNSVAIDLAKQGVYLLSHTSYSTQLPDYVSQESLEKLDTCSPEIQALVAESKPIHY